MPKITTKTIARPCVASNATFIGIDTALADSGVCLLRNDLAEFHLIRTQRLRGAKRLAYIAVAFEEILSTVQGESLGAIEAGSFGSGGRLYQLGQAQGLAQVAMFNAGISIAEIAPSRLKKFFTNHGAADKQRMVREACRTLGIKKLNDNLADAFALATLAEAFFLKSASTRKQAEVLLDVIVEVVR